MTETTSYHINNWAARMVESTIARYPVKTALWHYEHGLVVKASWKPAFTIGRIPFFVLQKPGLTALLSLTAALILIKKKNSTWTRSIRVSFCSTSIIRHGKQDSRNRLNYYAASFKTSLAQRVTVTGIKRSIPIKCGWMVSICLVLFWLNMLRYFHNHLILMKLLIKSC